MRTSMSVLAAATLAAIAGTLTVSAATTINPVNRFAYGANIGWVNFRGDVANGASLGEYVASGYIYAANVGWIHLGDGTPVNGIRYQNNAANDYGVNHDGTGGLRGFAYGANIGWVQFEPVGNPRINLTTGDLSGFVWGANIGWISLNTAFARVQTNFLRPGADTDGDGITDAWELEHFGNLASANATSDADEDGFSDLSECLADTDPLDENSLLRITFFQANNQGTDDTMTWTSRPSRLYRLQRVDSLNSPIAFDTDPGSIAPDAGATTTRAFSDLLGPMRFFRIEAFKPLAP